MADRILLRGGHVLTVDPKLGDIPGGDVLIEGDTVIIDGAIQKRGGTLTADWGSARKKVEASSAYLRDALAKKQKEAAGS